MFVDVWQYLLTNFSWKQSYICVVNDDDDNDDNDDNKTNF